MGQIIYKKSILVENKYLRQNIITLKDKFPSEFGRFIVALKI